jgi:hypothetical protein
MPVEPLTAREKRKLRREFRRKGYRAVYLEVSGYPQGKRACAHEWLRQKERASDRRKHWTLPFIVLGLTAGGSRDLFRGHTSKVALGNVFVC